MQQENEIQVWGGIECTINRVGDDYFDQLEYSGHYYRENDIDLIGSLGIKMLRYPVLWERHKRVQNKSIDWSFAEKNLNRLRELNIQPIVGLVHHGSGPEYVNFFDGSFEEGLAIYAREVAEKFPWVEYYTPVNEPLTTARFCGLYGHWYPHKADDYSFFKILLSECKATILAMQAIRTVNPEAKLIQTEDLGKCYSTPLLEYQAKMENERRWLSYELLCGKLTPEKLMWNKLIEAGITTEELQFFLDNPCVPHVAGFNYYLTSERYLDEDLSKYPKQYHGGNGLHQYADIETVRVRLETESGPYFLIKDAWERLQIPLAITECHLHSTREEQMRWFNEMWETLNQLKHEGVDVRAITAWAILGLYGWNCLVTKPCGDYEPGVFNLSSGCPRPTALARYLQVLTKHKVYYHPVLETEGWWKSENRIQYSKPKVVPLNNKRYAPRCQPVLILGKSGTLGAAFSRICNERNIHHLSLNKADLDITDKQTMELLIQELHPWAIINAAGFEKVDDAENDLESCFETNNMGVTHLAELCNRYPVKLLSFSSDLVFDGAKNEPYTESDRPNPLNVYGRSKAMAEKNIMKHNPNALIIRTSCLFGPWDELNFVSRTISELKEGRKITAVNDLLISPTYIPDLVHVSLDLLLDNEQGIFHVTNQGAVSWFDLGRNIALLSGLDASLIEAVTLEDLHLPAKRPGYSVLQSEKGIKLPTLDNALDRYMEVVGHAYIRDRVAV